MSLPTASLALNLLFICVLIVPVVHTQCPAAIRPPCRCSSTRFEPVNIVCEDAVSLSSVLEASGNPTTVIDSLTIADTPIADLPAYAFSGLAIKRLKLRNNGLTTIHPEAFDSPITQTLMELEIRQNQLGEVPQSGLPQLRALRTLVLAKNGIRSVPQSAFMNYHSRRLLKRLDLSGNRLQDLPAGAFAGLESLNELSLDQNYLEQIPGPALASLSELEDLSLAVNRITSVSTGSLPFGKLKSLSLEVNDISYIPRHAFQMIPNLLYLYIGSNRFTAIDPQLFFYIPKLKVLAMSNNAKIDRIATNAFQYVPDLVRLELAECNVSVIDNDALQKINHAQVIVLNDNQIKKISRTTFDGLTQLVSLDLKNNQISDIDDRAFSGLISLKQLNLGNNQLAWLNPLTFWNTFQRTQPATSRVLYLYGNQWSCDNRLLWLANWLRANPDIVIDAPGNEPTTCASPEQVKGMKLHDSWSGLMSSTQSSAVGIILGIFCLSLMLLMIVRYFVSKSRRDQKHDDERRLAAASSISGLYQAPSSSYALSGTSAGGGGPFHGSGGTAYPGTPEPLYAMGSGLHHASASTYAAAAGRTGQPPGGPQAQQGYFLNRPWYWWF